MPTKCTGYAVSKAGADLTPYEYTVRDLRDNDVEIEVHYCGLCHTDLHMIDNDWKCSQYPLVPGHEITGIVTAVGKCCTAHKVGDKVGVGYLAWSCRKCNACMNNAENYCKRYVPSYGFGMPDGEITRGGMSNRVVVPSEFTVKIPQSFGLDIAAPLLCAGITCWSPMKHFKMDTPGKKIGVLGLGGLGHMAVQFGAKFGNEVTVLSSSKGKETLAKELGATDFCLCSDPLSVKDHLDSLDFIIDTVSADKDMSLYLSLLKVDGIFVTVGIPVSGIDLKIPPSQIIFTRRCVAGSIVGSVKEMNEMMDFCVQHDVKPMIELLPKDKINEGISRLKKNDVKFRFVYIMKE